jgi:hypothetical protein
MRKLIITLLLLLTVGARAAESFVTALEDMVTTSHGKLTADWDQNTGITKLRLSGKDILQHEDAPMFISPRIAGNGKEFVLAFKATGGFSCGGEFVVVEIAEPIVLSKPFGNCNDRYSARVEGNSLVITMPSYIPHPELLTKSEIAKRKKTFSIYTWANGKLTAQDRVLP